MVAWEPLGYKEVSKEELGIQEEMRHSGRKVQTYVLYNKDYVYLIIKDAVGDPCGIRNPMRNLRMT